MPERASLLTVQQDSQTILNCSSLAAQLTKCAASSKSAKWASLASPSGACHNLPRYQGGVLSVLLDQTFHGLHTTCLHYREDLSTKILEEETP